ncbi:hypothetical protein CASFOL_029274 [Castilleja foliolosa]|uniref:Uncharacterized protein n=1 Tax=Castilleja foliolosa TaxID=1961234 RepID=A0ABD3CBY5_9LAMI
MTVVYGRHSGCAGGSDGPLPSRTGRRVDNAAGGEASGTVIDGEGFSPSPTVELGLRG